MFRLKIKSCAKLDSPYKNDNHGIYDFFVDVDSLPSGLPTKVNPRKVKTTTKVYRDIVKGLLGDDHTFYLDNRGMFITARGVYVHGDILYLDLGNDDKQSLNLYGIVDGGHTYHAIIYNRSRIAQDKHVYVHVEVITGVSNIVELAKDRNTNVQVQDKAIANLAGKFQPIKNILAGTKIAKKVSYTQNDVKKYKPVDVLSIISLMYAISYHSKIGNQPKLAYYSRSKDVLRSYIIHKNKYKQLIKFIPTLLKLYDFIEIHYKDAYKRISKNGRLGMYQGIGNNGRLRPTEFHTYKCHYRISKGLLLPIFSGLRCILKKHNGIYYWAINPYKVLKKSLSKLVQYEVRKDRVKKDGLKANLGGDDDVYSHCFDQVKITAILLDR